MGPKEQLIALIQANEQKVLYEALIRASHDKKFKHFADKIIADTEALITTIDYMNIYELENLLRVARGYLNCD